MSKKDRNSFEEGREGEVEFRAAGDLPDEAERDHREDFPEERHRADLAEKARHFGPVWGHVLDGVRY
ncbi:hypothetical protein FP2506_14744 [Fulvimarina pelagi HTCC2506]|uniref:Uncharacterized protein n=1 Tax=Fulvimarina pelagi HTCC2506 TaxID=314231 RepID=Q0G3Y1_9HYPH|nr:hypothetical protein FP2506_14744 [Fulvimarina pelagi HTCC2506]